ncbi:MAG: TetR/AcrR family transcriptional regulator [Gammaproteobacteria bacterium]|nr:TetR/AcrR family transcriptional regulator [Gammaproteobacteria bacterium]MCP5200866.1 TetR/AcrR family transcriptional regulator [Gammaproteobacteria bacterium]
MTPRARRRDGYHHGDLAAEVRRHALALVARRGRPDFTLRELATAAGVAHSAVYAHYANKEALVAALAVEGLDTLNQRQAQAIAPLPDDALIRLHAMGLAYVEFGRRQPGHYRLVFMRDAGEHEDAAVGEARRRAAGLMLEVIRAGQAAGRVRAGDAERIAALLWATAHGLAMLAITGQVRDLPGAAADFERTVDEALRAVLDALRA